MKATRMRLPKPTHTGRLPDLLCDFCGVSLSPARATTFPCRDFTRLIVKRGAEVIVTTCTCHTPMETLPSDEVTVNSVTGGWVACPECAAAVRTGVPETLAEIAARRALAEHGPLDTPATRVYADGEREDMPNTWLEVMRAAQEPFWLHREPLGS